MSTTAVTNFTHYHKLADRQTSGPEYFLGEWDVRSTFALIALVNHTVWPGGYWWDAIWAEEGGGDSSSLLR